MNKRITYVSDKEVLIQRNNLSSFSLHGPTRCRIEDNGNLHIGRTDHQSGGSWDDDGLDALAEVSACRKQHGSFATLRRVRPFTPQEAARHLGRQFVFTGYDDKYTLYAIEQRRILWDKPDSEHDGHTDYDLFADRCIWDDDGSPCGVIESEATR